MRKETILPEHYYHIYNRGVNQEPVFFSRANYVFFLQRLRGYFTDAAAHIIAYCLMPNHYHLLVLVKVVDFGHEVMQPFGVSYTKAINKQEARVGPLFQGPFKYRLVQREGYLLHLSRYIHLNPVAAGLVKYPADWEFSSYREYVGLRPGTLPKPEPVLSYFEAYSKRNGVLGKSSVSEAYADFVCGTDDHRTGLVADLLLD